MKFVTDSLKSGVARIGTLTDFGRVPDITYETPLVLIYTKGGSVPHLTKDVFKWITSDPQVLSISLPSTISMLDSIKYAGINFAYFVGMEEHINFLTVQDPASTTPPGFQQLDSISTWTRGGRHLLSADKYMDIVEVFKPDLYVALCDGDTNINSSRKRIAKAISRSKTLFDQCLVRHSASETLKTTGILGAIEGGYNIEGRTTSIEYLKDKPVIGYVIDGLHNNGPTVKNISSKQVKEIVKHSVDLLPVDKLRVSMGCWNPVTLLELVELGVDVFDTSYPYIAAQNSEALIFLCDHEDCKNVAHVMLLSEKRYADDFSSICSHCQCLTCKSHSRAYIHHLYNTKEMLHSVLLMIHNIHHYLEFFKSIRESITNGTFDKYKKQVSLKFKDNDAAHYKSYSS